MAKRDLSNALFAKGEAMLTRDELRETEDWFFDARPYASDNEWNIDAALCSDEPVLARPLSAGLSAGLSRRSSQSEGGSANYGAQLRT